MKKKVRSKKKKDNFIGNILQKLKAQSFINIATANKKNKPHASVKIFLKAEDGIVYIADYTKASTYKNIKANPKVSISLFDLEKEVCCQMYGVAKVIEKGKEYEKLTEKIEEKQTKITAQRVIKGVRRQKAHDKFDMVKRKKFVVYKIKVKTVSEAPIKGSLEKQSL